MPGPNSRSLPSIKLAWRVGVSYSTLMSWAHQGLIDPAHHPHRPWASVEWGDRGISEVALVARCREYGIPIPQVQVALDKFRKTRIEEPIVAVFLGPGKNDDENVRMVEPERAGDLLRSGRARAAIRIPTSDEVLA